MTDVMGRRIKPGDVVVLDPGQYEREGLHVGVVHDFKDTRLDLSTINPLHPEDTERRWHYVYRDVLIVGHAACLNQPNWPREVRKFLYEAWEGSRR